VPCHTRDVAHVVLLNLIFFIVPTCGATAFALFIYRFLKSGAPPEPRPPEGGTKIRLPGAGPEDLARSA
jgi:hypothetical protein